jgi:6-phosphogluconate dehydrogenase (decarboxylating)
VLAAVDVAVIGAADGLAAMARAAGLGVLARPLDAAEAAALAAAGIETVADCKDFFTRLEPPRLHLLDLASGTGVDDVIEAAYVTMEPGDVVLDAGYGYWGDTLRRARRMRHRALYYLDLALWPAGQGRTLLVAGEARGIRIARPLLERLAMGGRVVAAGDSGAAHFAQMVRDAFCTALVHARSEAQQLLEAFPGRSDAALLLEALAPAAAAGPRAGWVLEDALRLEAAVPLLAQAVMLEMAEHLDEQRPPAAPPRRGPFVAVADLD